MNIPDHQVQKILFDKLVNYDMWKLFDAGYEFRDVGDFSEVHWLNTPGPIYTTLTDNCGTGQIEALNNVGGDDSYREVIFKQPETVIELREIINAACVDPFHAYYFDGNINWNIDNIVAWWGKSEERVDYIMAMYKEELDLLDESRNTMVGDGMAAKHFYGPPENQKHWLNFYQFGLKGYLEWYIYKLEEKSIKLAAFNYDWTKRTPLDNLFKTRFAGNPRNI